MRACLAVTGLTVTGVLAMGVPAYAEQPAQAGPRPLVGDVIIFNDEIVEPVSAPVSTCGDALPLFSNSKITCKDASRVSDDDA
ncbi:hypothetical protein HII36_32785 [Nonomuraea sp. NN258]|uniref:hypothetical protein n=1 Tax=Nonomuraea antri TaxID=2730852 RepID=UPI00156A010D|nr:hypothetical protein [Nonomuraea antri]NRQ36575.1 hypothetical protein [Nonomuraea antri]